MKLVSNFIWLLKRCYYLCTDTLGYIFTAGQDVQLILPVSTPPVSAVHRFNANPSPADASRPASSAPDFFILVGPNTSIFQLDSRTGVLQLGPAPLSAHFTRPKGIKRLLLYNFFIPSRDTIKVNRSNLIESLYINFSIIR